MPAALTRYPEQNVPVFTKGTWLGGIAKSVEYPVGAILLGLLGNAVLTGPGVRASLAAGFRTEFFVKTGLVLLGASINFAVLVEAAGPAVAQAFLLIAPVFGFTWWLGGKLGLDSKLRALLSSAVSICGVSAAIAAAGAVRAKREPLACTASLVIVFALPSIFVLPLPVDALGLSPAVSAAVVLVGEEALRIATIVKTTQNALLGIVAVALTA
ncbi:putative sulfate exporter family transporter [Lentzea sp. CC55]|uniref:putative sulfate exporter family transporter n=1 Tax=Lentzea sp. CC55 TaxID=2884909 RepID=UPI0027E1A463|nr:putative sulfate exporter family transporter [Lentzea sp. CC55]MCG8925934.1 putative sulfate exporter family transporter [Lentzea sp. CC55]